MCKQISFGVMVGWMLYRVVAVKPNPEPRLQCCTGCWGTRCPPPPSRPPSTQWRNPRNPCTRCTRHLQVRPSTCRGLDVLSRNASTPVVHFVRNSPGAIRAVATLCAHSIWRGLYQLWRNASREIMDFPQNSSDTTRPDKTPRWVSSTRQFHPG